MSIGAAGCEAIDVLIIGAGPGGCTAAYELARTGWSVLVIEQRADPLDAAGAEAIAPVVVDRLGRMGIRPARLKGHPVEGVRVVIGGAERDLDFERAGDSGSVGHVVERSALDQALIESAITAGAAFWPSTEGTGLLYDQNVVSGVEARREGEPIRIQARHTIAADGAASRFAVLSGLASARSSPMGFAVEGIHGQVRGPTDRLELQLKAGKSGGPGFMPVARWVFPMTKSRASIGVAVFNEEPRFARAELQQFRSGLFECGRLPDLEPKDWSEGVLSFDFRPEECVAPGLVVVGAAAGMTNPFTGEGISYAVDSASLAAETIDSAFRAKGSSACTLALTEYADKVERRFGGYFAAGRATRARYPLVWRVLGQTLMSDRPLFALARSGALMPSGLAGATSRATTGRRAPHSPSVDLVLSAQLALVDDVVLTVVRREWPFLVRLLDPSSHPLGSTRPAAFCLAAAAVGQVKREGLVDLAAAADLFAISAIAITSLGTRVEDPAAPNWADRFSLMAADLALTRAVELTAIVGPAETQQLTELSAQHCEFIFRTGASDPTAVDLDEALLRAREAGSAFVQAPCVLGARFADVAPEALQVIANAATSLGAASVVLDDAERMLGRSRLGQAAWADLEHGSLTVPLAIALANPKLAEQVCRADADATPGPARWTGVLELIRRGGAIERSLGIVRDAVLDARSELGYLPPSLGRALLDEECKALLTRCRMPTGSASPSPP